MSSATTTTPSTRVQRYDILVIGAGQAGLAIGYHLAKRDADFVILDAASQLGASWLRRWDSLRLFTPAKYSGLPGMPFPAARLHLADKDEVAHYLERYARHFELPVRLDSRVTSLRHDGRRYIAEAGAIRFEANQIVVATGPFQSPAVPAFASAISPTIRQLHSSDYRNPFELPAGDVLVVGAGNSGAQIALEVARFRTVSLAGTATRHIPRTLFGADIYHWLWPILTRLSTDTWLGRKFRRRVGHDPRIGIAERALTEGGVRRRGRVTSVLDGLPVVDGARLDVKTIIWCTGFTPDFSWIKLPLALDHGQPRTVRGAVPESPGLYFVGLRFLHSMTSALLGGVGDDAAHIAARLIERSEG